MSPLDDNEIKTLMRRAKIRHWAMTLMIVLIVMVAATVLLQAWGVVDRPSCRPSYTVTVRA
jgi:hypothetical protein